MVRFAIGIVGDAGVRGTAQQPRLFVGMILILIFAEVLGQTKPLRFMIVYWFADNDQQVSMVLSSPCSWTQKLPKAVTAKQSSVFRATKRCPREDLAAMKKRSHYSVIICIEYLLAIVGMVKRLSLLGALQKRRTCNQTLPCGESSFFERGNITAIECQSLKNARLKMFTSSFSISFFLLLPQLYSPGFFFVSP